MDFAPAGHKTSLVCARTNLPFLSVQHNFLVMRFENKLNILNC